MATGAHVPVPEGMGPRWRLLIVDDDPRVRAMLCLSLRHLGIVLAVESGVAARAALDAGAFDVIVSDYDMPGENGVELLEHVRASRPQVRRVLMSGGFVRVTVATGGAVEAFLEKPFTPDDLRQVLEAFAHPS